MPDATQLKATRSPEQQLHVALSKALFFFEKGHGPIDPPTDAKWPEWRERYLQRGRMFAKISDKQGLVFSKAETNPEE